MNKDLLKNIALCLFWTMGFVAILLLANACGIAHHYNRMEHHKEKLIQKGEQIERDTITNTVHDTLTEVLTKNDTVYVTNTVTKTVTLEPEVIVKDRWRVRTEYKYKLKEAKEQTKQAKEQTKQIKKARNKSYWWIWLLFGIALGYVVPKLIVKQIKKL